MVTALPAMPCPYCERPMTHLARAGGPVIVSGYEQCLRRCDTCQIAYSNAAANPTRICKDPLRNLPEQCRMGIEEVLKFSMNERSRATKRMLIGFFTSEDAVTWTEFSFIAGERDRLPAVGRRFLDNAGMMQPQLLLWGAPLVVPGPGTTLRDRLVAVLDTIGEDKRKRSEPDVIIDCGTAGLIVIEVKHRARNDVTGASKKFGRYVDGSEAFRDPGAIESTGLYELARNWRIAWDLAEGRPLRLVNLGPRTIFEKPDRLDRFEGALRTNPARQFVRETWGEFMAGVTAHGALPTWLDSWLTAREVYAGSRARGSPS